MSSFHLKIVSLDGLFFDGEAKQVSLRTIDGEVSILAGHIPYVTAIGAGECRVYIEDTDQIRRAACVGGILTVTKEQVLVAATTFEWAEDIDYERAKHAKAQAEGVLSSGDASDHRKEVAKNKLMRAKVRLRVVENSKDRL
ncbi:MAG: ATP synthase F1 subunit epsilon [Clostridiales bacterium]|jgi:F-type H+-transporting ATPase subunit epsilon|nr:ATP synthase F1 subunit epsilon [Clostridiales bacterium]